MYAFFIDIDGTIIKNNKLINPKDIVFLNKVRELGCKIIYNTGRNKKGALVCMKKFNLIYDYLILSNGAQIIDKEGNEIYKKVIPKCDAEKIIEYCKKISGLKIFIFNGHETIGYYDGKTLIPFDGKFVVTKKYNFIDECKNLDSFISISLQQEDGKVNILNKVQMYIKDNYKDINACFNNSNLDVNHKWCTKGSGIKEIKKILGNETISFCIGDDYNDIEMFKAVDYPYTFKFTEDSISRYVKKRVDYVYNACEEILDFMEKENN